MSHPILDYDPLKQTHSKRTRWGLLFLLLMPTPFILFGLVILLTALGFFGSGGD